MENLVALPFQNDLYCIETGTAKSAVSITKADDFAYDAYHAYKKNICRTIKIFNLRPQEASILKQSALALGFDAAVHRGVLDCSVDISDALLTGSIVQFEKLAFSLKKQPFKMIGDN